MRWLWGLTLVPFLICGAVCFGGVIVAFVAGRSSAKAGSENAGEETSVPPRDVTRHG